MSTTTTEPSLSEKQELFSELLIPLLGKAHSLGYHVRLKELYRTEETARWNASHCGTLVGGKRCLGFKGDHGPTGSIKHTFKAIGIVNSLHRICLAIDLVLSKDGVVTWDYKDYLRLGEFWESLSHLCRWGGRFGDAGHFSITHNGRK